MNVLVVDIAHSVKHHQVEYVRNAMEMVITLLVQNKNQHNATIAAGKWFSKIKAS
jgi:hypothetical protein